MVHQIILPGTHISLTGVSTLHLHCGTSMVLPWLLPSSLLGGPLPLLISSSNFFALRSYDLNPSAPSNRVASSSSTSSQSRWRYSTILLFLSSSSATLCLLASSRAFSSASLFAFWATCSAQCNLTTFSSWSRSCCSFLCLHYISCCYFSRISALFYEISEWAEEDMMIQKQEQQTFFSVYVLLIQVPSWNFLGKPNRTLNKLNRTSKAQS